MRVSIKVNGTFFEREIDPRLLLVQFLREELELTGTKTACDTSQCGACTVHLDGMALKSCTLLAAQADGHEVTTIEGLANGELHPLQQSFWDNGGLQCGFCTPGMIMAAAAYLKDNPNPSDAEIRENMEGNLCRCTGYQNILKSIQAAAQQLAAGQEA